MRLFIPNRRTSQGIAGLVLVMATMVWISSAWSLEPPPLQARVTDLAGLLDPTDEARIEASLKAYEEETQHQFAVLLIPSLEGDPLEDFSIRVVEAWKLGGEKADNGLLVLISTGDRKMRIEVGHGLEGVIPDVLAARVIREVMTPAFKAGAFSRGIEDSLTHLMQAGRGEVVSLPESDAGGVIGAVIQALFLNLFVILIIGFFILSIIARASGRRRFQLGSTGLWITVGGSSGRSSGGGGFSSGGGFSGGGGSFGGGGASGGW